MHLSENRARHGMSRYRGSVQTICRNVGLNGKDDYSFKMNKSRLFVSLMPIIQRNDGFPPTPCDAPVKRHRGPHWEIESAWSLEYDGSEYWHASD